ncbi:MAG: response regulator [Gammaproteobacteria bacterium]|nr:response regulator [Gammaproteobacteria bacterium]
MPGITPSILLAEPSQTSIDIFLRLFENDYRVSIVNDGQACQAYIAKSPPDLLIISDQLADIKVLELCEKIRSCDEPHYFPIILLSESCDPVNLLAAYEAGYDEYATRPTDLENEPLLRARLSQLLQRHSNQLVKQSQVYQPDTPIGIMQGMGEIGNIILFLQNSCSCPDYELLSSAFFEVLANYGLTGTLMICGNHDGGSVFISSYGEQNNLENSVLESCRNKGTFVEFGNRSICNGSQCSFVIRNLPAEDEIKTGQLRSHLAAILAGMDARLKAINVERNLIEKQASVHKTIDDTRSTLALLDAVNKRQRNDHAAVLVDLGENIESAFFNLGLTDEQEEFFTDAIEEARSISDALYESAGDLDAQLQFIISRLSDAITSKTHLNNPDKVFF